MQNKIETLSDTELSQRIISLRKNERAINCEIIFALAEIEVRKLHLEQGYSSLFAYCRERLGYLESAANRRVRASRAVREYPLAAKLLREDKLQLSTLSQVSGSLTTRNQQEVLHAICGKSQREVEEFLASLTPSKPIRERIRPIAMAIEVKSKQALPTNSLRIRSGSNYQTTQQPDLPKTVTRFELKFAVSAESKSKLSKVQAMLSNKHPRGVNLETVFDELLNDYLKHHEPKDKPKKLRKPPCPKKQKEPHEAATIRKAIPKSLKAQVLRRDKHCCSYISPEGKRCASQWQLEIDHIRPVARGGRNELNNLRVLCRQHNQMMAERHFGREFMAVARAG